MADANTSVLDRELSTPIGAGGGLFCGVTEEAFAINGVTHQWPRGSRLKWGIAFTRIGELSGMDAKDAITAACKEISDCCDLQFEYTTNTNAANIKVISQRLDGPSGILADMQIPVGNVSVDNTQLIGRVDDSEKLGLFDNPPQGWIDFYRMILHEWLHACGLGHKPPSLQIPALISAMYSTSIRHLQKADIDELVRRYLTVKTPIIPLPPTGALPIHFSEVKEVWQGEGANKKLFRGTVTGTLQRVV